MAWPAAYWPTSLIDEAAGREMARRLGLLPIGVLGTLVRAKQRGPIGVVGPLSDLESVDRFIPSPGATGRTGVPSTARPAPSAGTAGTSASHLL
jgi:hypothetical protein